MFQKLYKHLEEISRNTERDSAQSLINEQWKERIYEQLESIKGSMQSQKKYLVPRSLLVSTVLISCLAFVLVIVVTWRSVQLSSAAGMSLHRSTETARQTGIAFRNFQTLQLEHINLEEKTARLDSLVQQQSQTIRELKKLNEVAIRSLIRMKKTIDRQAVQPAVGQRQL